MINLNNPSFEDQLELAPDKPYTHAACWITVGNVSLHVIKSEHCVSIKAYPHQHEMDDPISSMNVWFSDAQMEIDHAKQRGYQP